jgi:hypothetical protein
MGAVIGTYSSSSQELAQQHLQDKLWVSGDYSQGYYIKDNVPYEMGDQPSQYHRFDYAKLTWELDTQQVIEAVRNRRTQCLSAIDRINPLWWNSMTQSQQDEVAQYRQALLDITAQPGYPTQIEWPQKPSWL